MISARKHPTNPNFPSSFSRMPWSPEEDLVLLRRPDATIAELSGKLRRSPMAVIARRRTLRGGYNTAKRNRETNFQTIGSTRRARKRWTPDEDELLMTSDKSDVDIAKELGRTFYAVSSHRMKLNRKGTS